MRRIALFPHPWLTIPLKTAIIPVMSRKREVWLLTVRRRIKSLLRWFVPGLGVKRWFFILLAGITFTGVGLAIFLLDIYRTAPETWWLPVLCLVPRSGSAMRRTIPGCISGERSPR